MAAISTDSASVPAGLLAFVRRASRPSQRAAVVGVFAIASSFFTYGLVVGLFPIEPTQQLLIGMLLVNLILVLALAALIAVRLVRLWVQRRSGDAGAKLH